MNTAIKMNWKTMQYVISNFNNIYKNDVLHNNNLFLSLDSYSTV